MFNLKLKNKNKLIVLLLLIFIGIASFVFVAGAWLKYDREIKNYLEFDNGIFAEVTYLSENQGLLGSTTLNFYVSNYSGKEFDRPQLMSSENFKSIVPNDYLIIENASITPNSNTIPYYLRAKWVITYNGQAIDESLWGFYNIESLPNLNSTYWEKGKDGYYYNVVKDQDLNSYNSLHLNEKDTGSILFFEDYVQYRKIKFSDENKYNWDFIYYFDTNKLGISLLVETIQTSEEYVKLNWSPFSNINLVNDITQFEYRIDSDNNLIIDKYIGNLTDITIDSKMYLTAQQILDGRNRYNGTNNTLVGNELGAVYTITNIQGLNNKLKNIELPDTITTVNPALLDGYNHLESIKVNSSLTLNLPTLVREDYTFNGWYELNNKDEELTNENLFSSNILSVDKIYISKITKDNELLEDNIKDYVYRVNTETNEIEIVMYRGDKTEYKIPSKMYLTSDQINFGYISYAQRQRYDKKTVTINNTTENGLLNVVYVEKIKADTTYLELGNNIESLNESIFNKAYYLKTLKMSNNISFKLPSIKHNGKTLFWYYFEQKQDNFIIDINKIVENTNQYGEGYYYTAWLDGLDNPWTSLSDYSYTIDENDNLNIISYNGYKKNIVVPDTFSLSAVDYYNGRKNYDKNVILDDSLIIGKTLSVKKITGLNKNLTEVVLPNTISVISEGLFSDYKITKVTIPSSITKIEKNAFSNCKNLLNINVNVVGEIKLGLENTIIEEIGDGAFSGCTFANIELPVTLKKIGNYSFYNCENLKTIKNFNKNSTITYVGDFAFSSIKIENIEMPNTLEYLGEYAFSNCTKLKKVSNLENTIISEIKQGTFKNCIFTKISLPQSCTEIGEEAFKNCKRLIRIKISTDTGDIYPEAFSDCTKLRIVENLEKCKILKLQNKLFYNCSSLKYVEYPSTVAKIESLCFGNCTSLETIEISENVNEVSNDFIDGCSNLITFACLSKKLYKGDFIYSLKINNLEITEYPKNFKFKEIDGKIYITAFVCYNEDRRTSIIIPSYVCNEGVIKRVYGITMEEGSEIFAINNTDNSQGVMIREFKILEGIKTIGNNIFDGKIISSGGYIGSISISGYSIKFIFPDSLESIGDNNTGGSLMSNFELGVRVKSIGTNFLSEAIKIASEFKLYSDLEYGSINLSDLNSNTWGYYDIYNENLNTEVTSTQITQSGFYFTEQISSAVDTPLNWKIEKETDPSGSEYANILDYIGTEETITIPSYILDLETLKLLRVESININNINDKTLIFNSDNYNLGDTDDIKTTGVAKKLIIGEKTASGLGLGSLFTKELEIIGTLNNFSIEYLEKLTIKGNCYGDIRFNCTTDPIKEIQIDNKLTDSIIKLEYHLTQNMIKLNGTDYDYTEYYNYYNNNEYSAFGDYYRAEITDVGIYTIEKQNNYDLEFNNENLINSKIIKNEKDKVLYVMDLVYSKDLLEVTLPSLEEYVVRFAGEITTGFANVIIPNIYNIYSIKFTNIINYLVDLSSTKYNDISLKDYNCYAYLDVKRIKYSYEYDSVYVNKIDYSSKEQTITFPDFKDNKYLDINKLNSVYLNNITINIEDNQNLIIPYKYDLSGLTLTSNSGVINLNKVIIDENVTGEPKPGWENINIKILETKSEIRNLNLNSLEELTAYRSVGFANNDCSYSPIKKINIYHSNWGCNILLVVPYYKKIITYNGERLRPTEDALNPICLYDEGTYIISDAEPDTRFGTSINFNGVIEQEIYVDDTFKQAYITSLKYRDDITEITLPIIFKDYTVTFNGKIYCNNKANITIPSNFPNYIIENLDLINGAGRVKISSSVQITDNVLNSIIDKNEYEILMDEANKKAYVKYVEIVNDVVEFPSLYQYNMTLYSFEFNATNKEIIIPNNYHIRDLKLNLDEGESFIKKLVVGSSVTFDNENLFTKPIKEIELSSSIGYLNLYYLLYAETIKIKVDLSTPVKIKNIDSSVKVYKDGVLINAVNNFYNLTKKGVYIITSKNI